MQSIEHASPDTPGGVMSQDLRYLVRDLVMQKLGGPLP
jgi:hypothetical protein